MADAERTRTRRRWHRRIPLVVGAAAGGALLLVLSLLVYLANADLGRHRERIERRVSDALGYDAQAGELHVDLALWGVSRLVAEDVRLTSRHLAGAPPLVEIDYLSAAVELWPLLGNEVVVRDLDVRGCRVCVSIDGEGRTNWAIPATGVVSTPGEPEVPRIVVDRASFERVRATVGGASLPRPIVLDDGRLELRTDAADRVELRLAGSLNDRPLEVAGSVGPVAELVVAGGVQHDLRVEFGGAVATARGTIAQLATLDGVDGTLTAEGPDARGIAESFAVPPPGDGPFRVSATLRPEAGAVGFDFDAAVGALRAAAHGELDSLTAPRRVDVAVEVDGPDLASAAASLGADGLPAEPFGVEGRVAWDGFPLACEQIRVRIGESRFEIDGLLGAFPDLSGTRLRLEGEGPDLAVIASLIRVTLPTLPYRLAGRVEETGGNLVTDGLQVRIGESRLEIAGRLGRPPDLAGTDLTVHARGPSLAPFRESAGLDLPDEPFDLHARVLPRDGGLRLERSEVRIGSSSGRISGRVAYGEDLSGTRLRVEASGEDLAALAWAHGLRKAPRGPFRVAAGITLSTSEVHLDDLSANLGEVSLDATGSVGLRPGAAGTRLHLRASGPDAAEALALAGVDRAPSFPFRLSGTVELEEAAVVLDGVEAEVGDLELAANGRLAIDPAAKGTDLQISAAGKRLSDLEAFTGPIGLPDAAFELAGRFGIEQGAYRLTGAALEVGEHEIRVDGVVVPSADPDGSRVSLSLAGPDLAALGQLAASVGDLPALPAEPYSVKGSLAAEGGGFRLDAVVARVGSARAALDGRLGAWPELRGSDLTFDVDGPDASLVGELLGVDLPGKPFRARGRAERSARGGRFEDLSIRLGDHRLWLDGTLGEPPRLVGSDLRFRLEGPDLSIVERLLDVGGVPEQRYALAGHARGSPRLFRVDDIDLQLGETDVRGHLELALEERPRLEGQLESANVDLRHLGPATEEPGETTVDPAEDREERPGRERVFGDEPFELQILERFDADVAWRIERLETADASVTGFDLGLSLEAGALRVGPFEATGARGGKLSAGLRLGPGDAGYDLDLDLRLENVRVALAQTAEGRDDPLTRVDARIDLRSRGRTPHEVAAAAEGRMVLALEGGRLDDSLVRITAFDVLRRLLRLVNPYRDASREPAELECAVFVIEAGESRLRLEPVALRTENVTIVGRGGVNLENERLDLEWVAKPRKGLGISSTAITNPYIKLGGTLGRPRIDVKPVNAIATTGVAVATGGLSLLGKGLWDRMTAEKDICKKAMRTAEQLLAEEPGGQHGN